MEWYVFRYNTNRRKIERFNIFDHGAFFKDFNELRKKKLEREELSYELNRILMYYFWGKYEYETIISEYSNREGRVEAKIDIYEQVRMNWDGFVNYVLGNDFPINVGDTLWYVDENSQSDPIPVTVCMLTQKADRSWKIRTIDSSKLVREIKESSIGYRFFRDKSSADSRIELLRLIRGAQERGGYL